MTLDEIRSYDPFAYARTVYLTKQDAKVRALAFAKVAPFRSKEIADELGCSANRVAGILSTMRWPRTFTTFGNRSLWTPAPKA